MVYHKSSISRTALRQWLVVVVLGLMVQSYLSAGFHMPVLRHHRAASPLNAFALTSALESRVNDTGTIRWIKVGDDSDTPAANDSCCRNLPLYPLSACYLPTGQHQLRNTEPRNLKMAFDLGIGGRFCVVFSALDTGRIASVGTIFRILDMEPQNDPASGKLVRILLTCEAEELVNVQTITNPEVAQWENRLKRSDEYLIATVCPRLDTITNAGNMQQVFKSILQDYNLVSQMYKRGIGAENLPPFSRDRLEEVLPSRSLSSSMDISAFWQLAQDWQTLCYTVREGHQIALVSDRNEMLIDAAVRKGGPLNLPVHVEDLLLEDRKRVQNLEVKAQHRWLSLNLDPSIDFQTLLSFDTYDERLEYFARMIHRERTRHESLLQTNSIEKKDFNRLMDRSPNKGAWFDDSAWS